MKIHGLDSIQQQLDSEGYFVKLIANESAVLFFDASIQHRDAKQAGLSYEDDSNGNAIAGTMRPGRIDFRRHQEFSEERVRELSKLILEEGGLTAVRDSAVFYGGKLTFSRE